MTSAGQGKFVIEGNKLIVRGELGPEDEKAYAEVLFEFLKAEHEEFEIDLTGLHHMSSAYIGSTCLFTLVAKRHNHSVTIFANEEIGRILHMVGLDKLTEVRISPG